MGALSVLFLSIAAINLVFSAPENVSIVTEGEIPSSTPEEIKRMLEADFLEDEDHGVFKRAKGAGKWGGGKYTRKEQKSILEAHNNYRRWVSPESSNMNEMLWSSELAERAQAWSDGCVYEHPNKDEHEDYKGIGQNLYIKWLDEGGNNPPSVLEPVDLWYDEVKDYHYQQNSCSGVCGHYTQIVWATTNKVGCGITFCPLARDRSRTYENAWLVTCNYSPGGNIWGERPYEAGQKCSSCTLSMKKGFCSDGLCSKCKRGVKGCECNLQCQNCGALDRKKCRCACPNGYYGPVCEHRCEDHNPYCGANPGWPAFLCDEQHPDVLEGCPAMCQLCKPGDGRPRC